MDRKVFGLLDLMELILQPERKSVEIGVSARFSGLCKARKLHNAGRKVSRRLQRNNNEVAVKQEVF